MIFQVRLPFSFSDKNFILIFVSSICTVCPAHLILHDLAILIIFGKNYKLWSFLSKFLLISLKQTELQNEAKFKSGFKVIPQLI